MKKRTYITPLSESINVVAERLMEVASPGVGGGYDPGKPIDGKGSNEQGFGRRPRITAA